MNTYNIHVINKNSTADRNQDYAFFSELPKLSSSPVGSPVFSNVFDSTTLTRGETWNIGMTNNFFAWCGKADRKLRTDAKIDLAVGKLATLGTSSAPGSTFTMFNNAGHPAFRSQAALTANVGSFAIESGHDFSDGLNFMVGVGATDDNGRLKPLTTIWACRETTVNITPVAKFYLAAYSSSVGTVIDATVLSKHAATIDFSENASMYGAVVVHEGNGDFTVQYTTQEDFTKIVAAASTISQKSKAAEIHPSVDPRDAELTKLREQIQRMQLMLDAASRDNINTLVPASSPVTSTPMMNNASTIATIKDPYPVKVQITWYKASLPFRNSPGQSRRRDIRDKLIDQMQARGYTYEGGSIDGALLAMFSHPIGTYGAWHSLDQSRIDWSDTYLELPQHLKQYTDSDPRVFPAQESRGLWRAHSSSSVNGAHHDRKTSTPSVKSYINGTRENEGTSKNNIKHKRENSRSSVKGSTKVTVAVDGANVINGLKHDTTSNDKVLAKRLTNGISETKVTNNSNTQNEVNGTSRRYDYPRVQEDAAMAAKKRRAREVLKAEGLEEYAGGWRVTGH